MLAREWWNPGFSSPADRYTVKNSGDQPFPFYFSDFSVREFGTVEDKTTRKFIYGDLDIQQ